MAIRVYGLAGSIDAKRWSQLHEAQSLGAPLPAAIVSGGKVSASAGTRTVSISAGSGYAPGVYIEWDAQTLSLAATPSNRITFPSIQVDWSGTETTAGTFVDVKGAAGSTESNVEPTFTRNAGTLYQIPLARVEITSTTTLTGGMIDDRRPLADSGWVNCTPGPAFTLGSGRVAQVRRLGKQVTFGGSLKRTGPTTVNPGGDATLGGLPLIPKGFRPDRNVFVTAWTKVGTSNIRVHTARIRADLSDITIWPGTGAIVENDELIFQETTWLTGDV